MFNFAAAKVNTLPIGFQNFSLHTRATLCFPGYATHGDTQWHHVARNGAQWRKTHSTSLISKLLKHLLRPLYKYCTYTVQRAEQVVVYSGLGEGKKKMLLRGVRDEAQGATALGDSEAEAVISSR